MKFSVQFYRTLDGEKPVATFISTLRTKQPRLHKLVLAGIKKLENSQYHGGTLTKSVDAEHGILELRVGNKDIARVFWFYGLRQSIVLTHGYVKKKQELDPAQLQRARECKKDWEARTG